jgi:hypothetical protein
MHATVRLESLPQSSSLFDRFIEIDPDRYAPHWCNVMRSAVKFSFDWWKIPRIDCEKPFIRHQIALGDIIEMMQEYKEQLEVPVPVRTSAASWLDRISLISHFTGKL